MIKCERCGDPMDRKFLPFHNRVCRWLTMIEERDIETFLIEMEPYQ